MINGKEHKNISAKKELINGNNNFLLIDDVHINSVRVLCDFLIQERSYKLVTNIGNTKAFQKILDSRVWGWKDQKFNNEKTRAMQSLYSLAKRKFALRRMIKN